MPFTSDLTSHLFTLLCYHAPVTQINAVIAVDNNPLYTTFNTVKLTLGLGHKFQNYLPWP